MDATAPTTPLARQPYPKPAKRPKRRKKGLRRRYKPRTDAEIACLARYRMHNPDCELCMADGVMQPAAHTHHILGGHGRRVHRRWNLFTACLEHHLSFEARKKYWTDVLVAIKQAKGEWNPAAAAHFGYRRGEYEESVNETG